MGVFETASWLMFNIDNTTISDRKFSNLDKSFSNLEGKPQCGPEVIDWITQVFHQHNIVVLRNEQNNQTTREKIGKNSIVRDSIVLIIHRQNDVKLVLFFHFSFSSSVYWHQFGRDYQHGIENS